MLSRLRGSLLGDIVDDIAAYLHERGHTPKVAQAYLCGAGHFAHWLDRERLSPKAVSEATLASFMDRHLAGCRCRVPHGSRRHLRPALGHVLAVLRARGWAAPPSLPAQKPVDRLLNAFTVYLQETRGAAATTCRRNAEYARRFLEPRYGAAEVTLQDLGPEELLRFVLEQTRECAPGTAGLIRSALRSFLRFAHVHGLCDASLAAPGSARAVAARKVSRCSRTTWWRTVRSAWRGVEPRDATGAQRSSRAAVSRSAGTRRGHDSRARRQPRSE